MKLLSLRTAPELARECRPKAAHLSADRDIGHTWERFALRGVRHHRHSCRQSADGARRAAQARLQRIAWSLYAVNRRWELDALRGLMLVLMTLTHLPTRWAGPTGQPLGFVSAAEGFVLLSAYMAGLVYTRRGLRDGLPAMRTAFLRRAGLIYACQAAMLLFLFTVIALLGLRIDQPAITNLLSFYLAEPVTALWSSLLLIYEPPLLDILPLYVLFMLVSPWVLAHALARGWGGVLAISVMLWLLAQFGLGDALYRAVTDATGLTVPPEATGAFAMYAWQFLWVLGLWMGATQAGGEPLPTMPAWLVRVAVVVAGIGLLWRHGVGQVPFPGDPGLNLLFSKWQLGPLRLLNLFALLVLTLHYGPALARRLPPMTWLQNLGAASLPVFCAHLVLVLLALALVGEPTAERALWVDLSLLAACFAALTVVAHASADRPTDPPAPRWAGQRT